METEEKEEVSRLSKTLGKGKDKYYVYMLTVENEGKPFYIGKGAGARVFAHEIDAQKLLDAIKKDRLDAIKKDRDDEETDYDGLSDKIKTILDNNRKIKKVIVKWGLTSEEAFMCESALINMYDYLCENPSIKPLSKDDVLSNIVNGHASNLEKKSRSIDGYKTKARDINGFMENVAIEETTFPRIIKRCVFIKINRSMDLWFRSYNNGEIDRNKYIKDSVSGFWPLRKFNDETKPEYVIALYEQVVVGVFEVKECKKFGVFNLKEFPQHPILFRKNELCALESVIDRTNFDGYIKKAHNKIDANEIFDEQKYKKFIKMTGFVLEETKNEGMLNLVGKLLNEEFLRKAQKCFCYNYNNKGVVDYAKWKP